ncbi:MAG TPA: hypothetical protein VKA74_09805 [Myxococcota bacterium]|nr:hypothetical protein [Myxococcota bacterium]
MKRKDVVEYANQPLTDEEKAAIWLRYEETGLLRGTARDLGVSLRTVQRVLGEDPLRLQGIKQARAEERAARWRRIEDKSLDELERAIDDASSAFTQLRDLGAAKGRKKIDAAHEAMLKLSPRRLTALRMVADSATTKTNLLQGSATENIKHTGGLLVGEMTAEQMVEKAQELGLDELITPAIRELVDGGDDAGD